MQIVLLPKVTRTTCAHPARVSRLGVRTSDHGYGNTSTWGITGREAGKCQLCRLRGQVLRFITEPPLSRRPEKGRPREGELRARRADTGREKVTGLTESRGASVLCPGILQQFRTGSEPVSGDRRCRWVFKQPTCKWSLAKIPRLTAFFFFFFFFVRNAIFRYSRRNVAFCLLRAGVQMSTASSGECQVLESCHWVCKLPNTIPKLLQEAGWWGFFGFFWFLFCRGFQQTASLADPVSGLNSSVQPDFYFVFVSKCSPPRQAGF